MAHFPAASLPIGRTEVLAEIQLVVRGMWEEVEEHFTLLKYNKIKKH